jgi:cell division protein FtsQ
VSARIARGGQSRSGSRGKPAAARGGKGGRKTAAPALDALPEKVRKVSWWIFIGMLVALAVAAASAFGLFALAGRSIGEGIGKAGFAVRHVEIKGAVHVPQLDVYNIAFDQPSPAMPLVDLEGTRERLLRFGWIKDARVSRRLPDTLVVDIIERRPAAIWQQGGQLNLIDNEGVVLEAVKLHAMPDLPVVIGPAANRQAANLARLTASVPHLKPMMEGASWVGKRRWDIRFQSGETLALPEGEEASARALAHFARMDQATQLLGRGFVRFDMRVPGKFIVRVSRTPGSTVPDAAPQPPPGATGTGTGTVDASTTI